MFRTYSSRSSHFLRVSSSIGIPSAPYLWKIHSRRQSPKELRNLYPLPRNRVSVLPMTDSTLYSSSTRILLFKRSVCLSGKGPSFLIVISNPSSAIRCRKANVDSMISSAKWTGKWGLISASLQGNFVFFPHVSKCSVTVSNGPLRDGIGSISYWPSRLVIMPIFGNRIVDIPT